MGKIDWYCQYCKVAFRSHEGRCPECQKPIIAVNKFTSNRTDNNGK